MSAQETIERLKKQAEEEADEETDEPEAEAPKNAKASTREYIVFEADGKGGWREITRAEAATFDGAVETLGEHIKKGVTYGGTPSRNWHEGEPVVETVTTIKFKRTK